MEESACGQVACLSLWVIASKVSRVERGHIILNVVVVLGLVNPVINIHVLIKLFPPPWIDVLVSWSMHIAIVRERQRCGASGVSAHLAMMHE